MRSRRTVAIELARAEEESARAADARFALPPGSSRARVTTANARWARKAEHRDRLRAELQEIDAKEADHA